jgi:hypothetical protein
VPSCAAIIGVVALVVIDATSYHRRPAAVVLAFTVTLLAAVAKLAFDALVQHEAAPVHRGRTFARLEATFQLVWVLAALVPVAVALPLVAGFGGVAALTLLAVAGTLRTRRLARRGLLGPRWTGEASAPRAGGLDPRPEDAGPGPGGRPASPPGQARLFGPDDRRPTRRWD